MLERDEEHFMIGFLTWMKPGLIPESITVYNFGYERPLPFPSVALTPDSTLRFNLQTSGMKTPSRRSTVVIGEKYASRFEEIMVEVDRIHEETQALPFAIFLQTQNENNLIDLSSHHMHESPSLVGIL